MEYIALLRGVNVGGHVVKMADLRAQFQALGLEDVRTYIQSGNVFFTANESDREALSDRIERHLEKRLGYEVATCLRTPQEVRKTMARNPFDGLTVTPDMRLCVVFTRDPIPKGLSLPLVSSKKDLEILSTTRREAFVVWHVINGRPPSSAFLDQSLGKKTTSRFYHTMAKILEAATAKPKEES